jgi:hypothetical protein
MAIIDPIIKIDDVVFHISKIGLKGYYRYFDAPVWFQILRNRRFEWILTIPEKDGDLFYTIVSAIWNKEHKKMEFLCLSEKMGVRIIFLKPVFWEMRREKGQTEYLVIKGHSEDFEIEEINRE